MPILIPRREVWTRQPQHPVTIDWSNPLAESIEYVMLGSQRFYNPTGRQITRVRVNPDLPTRAGIGASIQKTEYETYPLPVATGGTNHWTMAGLFIPIMLSTSVSNADGNAVAGCCEAPGTALSYDRIIYLQNTTQAWRGYLYDGATKFATSAATAQVGKLDKVVVTTNGATLVCAVDGAADASVAVSSTGYNGYTSAEFCLGNPVGAGGILQTAIPLFIKANRFWPNEYRKAFFANPWQIFKPRNLGVFFPVSAGGGSVSLTIADATHGHTADALGLTSAHALAIADALHAHAADPLVLSTDQWLAVADALHAHAADNVVLDTTGSATLAVADALHAHAADAITLTTQSALAIADATHGHAADNVVLDTSNATTLTIAEALHGHTADSLALSTRWLLTIADATHGHTADVPTLSLGQVALAIADALHAHRADVVTLNVGGDLVGNPRYIVIAATRLSAVVAAARRYTI